MFVPEFTTVIGVDKKHLLQAAYTVPTWFKTKPELLKHPMVVFYDWAQVNDEMIRRVIKHPDLRTFGWPLSEDAIYDTDIDDKWHIPQRYKMLAGFVHVPKLTVDTKYWLKIDTDTIASGEPDWIDPLWFENDPAIVSHPWGFTKPANQMELLDAWVESNPDLADLRAKPPLELKPKPGWSRLRHKRIISWCGFFDTGFCWNVSDWCNATSGWWQLPVRSQDGVHWYCAQRLGHEIVRTDMKSKGWEHWGSMKNITKRSDEIMGRGSST